MATVTAEAACGQAVSEEQIQRLVHCPETLDPQERTAVEVLLTEEGGSRDRYLTVLRAKKAEMPDV